MKCVYKQANMKFTKMCFNDIVSFMVVFQKANSGLFLFAEADL